MQKHELSTVYASEIDSQRLIISEDELDANNNVTLDAILLHDDGKVSFKASSCSGEVTYVPEILSTDTLVGISDWLRNHEDQLANPIEAYNEK